jgi:hypothetical protein
VIATGFGCHLENLAPELVVLPEEPSVGVLLVLESETLAVAVRVTALLALEEALIVKRLERRPDVFIGCLVLPADLLNDASVEVDVALAVVRLIHVLGEGGHETIACVH